MTPEQEAIKEKFKEIWIRWNGSLSKEVSVDAYYVVGLLLDVFKEINKEKK